MTVNSYTDEDVCNIATSMLKVAKIFSISNPTTDAEADFARTFPIAVDTLLSKHDWKFCEAERALAVDADETPLRSYDYAYRLPSNMVAGPFAVWGDGSDLPVSNYINAGDYIHCDYTSVTVSCRIKPDISIWPYYFIDLVAHDLCVRLGDALTSKDGLSDKYRIKTYGSSQTGGKGGFFADAKLIDSRTRTVQTLFNNGDPLTNTRY